VIVENLPRLQWKLIPEKRKRDQTISARRMVTQTFFLLGAQVITQQRDVVKRGIRFHIMIGTALLLGIHGLRQQSLEPESINRPT
jgi:hypothetical protein